MMLFLPYPITTVHRTNCVLSCDSTRAPYLELRQGDHDEHVERKSKVYWLVWAGRELDQVHPRFDRSILSISRGRFGILFASPAGVSECSRAPRAFCSARAAEISQGLMLAWSPGGVFRALSRK